MKRKLPVDLVAISTNKVIETLKAIQYSVREIEFNNVYFFTNEDIDTNFNIIKIPKFSDIIDFNNFTLDLNNYVVSEFALLIQHDGHIVNPSQWKDEFLNYDYIGAPWPSDNKWNNRWRSYPEEMASTIISNLSLNRVGNGGFSLRSKKFLEYASGFKRDFKENGVPEDIFLNVYNYKLAKDFGIKYPPVSTALDFSCETPLRKLDYSKVKKYHFFNKNNHFGWHGNKFLNSKKILNLKFN